MTDQTRPFTKKLYVKFMLAVCMLLFAVLVGMAAVLTFRQKNAYENEMKNRWLNLARNAGISFTNAVNVRDYAFLEEFNKKLSEEEDVVYSAVLDDDMHYLVHTNSKLIGETAKDDLATRCAKERKTLIEMTSRPSGTGRMYETAIPIIIAGEVWGVARIGYSAARLDAIITGLYTEFGILAAIFLLAGIAGALFLARNIASPVVKLADLAEKVADGDLNVRSAVSRGDELGLLSDSFNTMVSRLDASQKELKKHQQHLEDLVEERTAKLKRANEQLKEEITEREQAEKQRRLVGRILEMINQSRDEIDVIRSILLLIKEFTGIEAAGIRLKEGIDYPYYEVNGFPKDFVEAENFLCARDPNGNPVLDSDGNPLLECMCGNIIRGRFDSSYPFFTEGGSFWSNGTTELLASTSEEDRQARTRNRCNGVGYESVALIPLRAEDEIIGLLQLNDKRENMFTPQLIAFFEEIGASIGISLARRWARDKLKERENYFRSLISTLHEEVIVLDRDYRISDVNDTFLSNHGFEREDVLGSNCYEVSHGYDKPCHEFGEECKLIEVFETGEPANCVHEHITGDGLKTWMDILLSPMKDSSGNVTHVIEASRNISDLIRTTEALRENEEKYRLIYETAGDAIMTLEPPDWRFTSGNYKIAEMFGVKDEEEFISLTPWQTSPEYQPDGQLSEVKAKEMIGIAMKEGENFFEWTHKRVGGEDFFATVLLNRIEIREKVFLQARVNDITERKRAEEELRKHRDHLDELVKERTAALRESEGKYSTIVQTSIDGFWISDMQGRLIDVNDAYCRMIGYTRDELLQMRISDVEAIEKPGETAAHIKKILKDGYDKFETQHRHKDGGIIDIEISVNYIEAAGEQLFVFLRDITERKLAEEEIKSKSGLLEAINTVFKEAITCETDAGVAEVCLSVAEKLTGSKFGYIGELNDAGRFDAIAISNPGWDACKMPESKATMLIKGMEVGGFWGRIINSGEAEAINDPASDPDSSGVPEGHPPLTCFLGVPLKQGDKTFGLIGLANKESGYDSTDVENMAALSVAFVEALNRKRIEQELAGHRDHLEELVEERAAALKKTNVQLKEEITERKLAEKERENLLIQATERTKEISCLYEVTKLLGEAERPLKEMYQSVVELIPLGWQYPEITCAKIVYEGVVFKTRNYKETPWNLTADIMISGKWAGAFEVTYLEKKPELDEGPFQKEERDLIDAIVREIEKMAERRQLEAQLQQSQKMEAIGRLAGGIAHDFNNLLTGILGYSQLTLDSLGKNDPMRLDIEEIKKAGESASKLTMQLLAFSRKQVLEPKIFNLNDTVADIEKMLQRVIGEDIEFLISLDSELGQVRADPAQVEQVIMNLAVNARDAMPNGGKLTIETANVELDEAYAANHVGAKPGFFVMLAVSDSGSGMDEDTRSHLFEPFFTTKEKGRGTGLGLSTVYGTVKQSGGYIWVYSEPGMGTTFKIYLPRVEETIDVIKPGGSKDAPVGGTETILLVEDEEMVREFAKRVLTSGGYTVLEAGSGGEALIICEKHDGPIHLMLTDVVMPGMSGSELAERLAGIKSDMKVLYMSGYTENAIVHHGVLDSDKIFIQKPFTIESLTGKVREILSSPKK